MHAPGPENPASLIDLSCVQADHTVEDIVAMAEAARKHSVCAVFALPAHTARLRDLMAGTPVKLGGTVGFPSGSATTEMKVAEAKQLIDIGVQELDMVVNITWLRSGEREAALRDVRAVVRAAEGVPVKLILEVAYLGEEQIREGCEIGIEAGVAFVKSGTGWAGMPTTFGHVRSIAGAVRGRCGIKVAGGIRDLATLVGMYELGVRRFGIGTRSALGILGEAGRLHGV